MIDENYFLSRNRQFEGQARVFNKKFKLFAGLRLVVFLAGLILAVFFANAGLGSALTVTIIISVALFFVIVKYHNRIRYQRDHAKYLAEINADEVARIKGNLNGFDPGDEFHDEEHPYSADLDVFGKNSLFQLLNRTVTQSGRKLLAHWLKEPAAKTEILSRQEAITELSKQVDWRQHFYAIARHSSDSRSDFSVFDHWLQEPAKVSRSRFFRVAMVLLPSLTFVSIVGWVYSFLSYHAIIGMLVANAVVLGQILSYAGEMSKKAAKSLETIRAFDSMIRRVEEHSFRSMLLLNIQHSLHHDGNRASQEIKKLAGIMNRFDSRSNMFFFILDLVLLVDFYWLLQAESWKQRNLEQIKGWIDQISQMEALTSLAGTLHVHNEFRMPEIVDEYELEVAMAGHPLIERNSRICNDFKMRGLGSEIIITGSNMSGKSTFLRTIGVNMVLAFCGGPVCCKSAKFPIMKVFTSMRTHDDLEEHISSFYAELKRIHKLLEILDHSSIPVFYLLDEILKGTNSEDRHLGAESLLMQLIPLQGMGLISTHDLVLSEMASKFDNISNFSFDSSVEGSEIKFDYKIKNGVCRGFNASKLMEKMGIELHNNKE